MKRTLYQSFVLLILSSVVFHLSSCNKKETQEVKIGESSLIIKSAVVEEEAPPIVINEYKESSDGKIASLKSINQETFIQAVDNIPQGDIISAGEFDALIETEAHPEAGQSATLDKKIAASKNKTAATQSISPSIKFRLIIYKASDLNTPLVNKVLSVNENPNIQLNMGDYKWFAFSTNEATVPNINSSGVVNKSDLTNKDFMFATNSITLNEGNNFLQIVFQRQMAKIEVDLNTRGVFGPMQNATAVSVGSGSASTFTNLMMTGNFSIKTGQFALETVNTSISAPGMSIVSPKWGNSNKIATFYTAVNTPRTIAANTLKTKIYNLSITLDNGDTRTFSSEVTVPVPHTASLNIQKGKHSKVHIRLIESAIKVGGVYWARTNLVYVPAKLNNVSYIKGESDAYRFRPNNEYSIAPANEYWNHNTTTPNGTDYGAFNVCGRVFPEAVWITPPENTKTNSEYLQLLRDRPKTASKTTVPDGTRYSLIWQRDSDQPANSAYPDNHLLLSAYGYRNTSGTITQRPNGTNGSGQLHYWASTADSNQPGYPGYVLRGTVSSGTMSTVTSVEKYNKAEGRNVRCIRNPNYNATL